jgi:predicted nucleotidyltransferase
MISQETIQKAVELLRKAANPVKIILFGSYARGDVTEASDLDLLVIEKEVKARRMEMVRLNRVLRPLRIPVDIIVMSEDQINDWGHLPGTVLYEALLEGRVVYEKETT